MFGVKCLLLPEETLCAMSNKAKRNLFLVLLIIEGLLYISLAVCKSRFNIDVKWWIFFVGAVLFSVLLGGYRNFSQAVKEDNQYGSV